MKAEERPAAERPPRWRRSPGRRRAVFLALPYLPTQLICVEARPIKSAALRRSTSRAIMEMQRRAKAYPVVAVDAAA